MYNPLRPSVGSIAKPLFKMVEKLDALGVQLTDKQVDLAKQRSKISDTIREMEDERRQAHVLRQKLGALIGESE